MTTKTRTRRTRTAGRADPERKPLRFIRHRSFYRPNAERRYTAGIEELINATGRLTPDEERTLFEALNYVAFSANRAAASSGARRRRAIHWRRLHERIRDRLVSANLGLVYDLVRRSRFKNIDTDELVSDGLMALLLAVDAFNPWKGYRFSTYACNAILRAFMRRSLNETKRRAVAAVSYDPELERSDHDETRRDEAVELYGERLRTAMDDDETGMTESERYVLSRRFPDDPEERRLTLEEIGRSIHVSKERVRQIQNAALTKLREALTNDPILQD